MGSAVRVDSITPDFSMLWCLRSHYFLGVRMGVLYLKTNVTKQDFTPALRDTFPKHSIVTVSSVQEAILHLKGGSFHRVCLHGVTLSANDALDMLDPPLAVQQKRLHGR